jgi:thymidylate synthase (FAD)
MPIFVMRQFVRHRMQNLNEISARYTELPEEFYIPNMWRTQDTKNKQGSIEAVEWSAAEHDTFSQFLGIACTNCFSVYKKLLRQGVAKEMARLVLPVNTYTEVYSCWDLKNLLNFIALRDDPHAQWEIQQYGKAIKEIATKLFPWTLECYEKYKFTLQELS